MQQNQPTDSSSSGGTASTGLIDAAAAPADAESRADDVLPDSLTDALEQAAESTLLALQSGSTRCIVRGAAPVASRMLVPCVDRVFIRCRPPEGH